MCYFEGCPNQGKYQCRVYMCCKNLGCGRLMCKDHKNKKCIKAEGKCGNSQHACLEHEDAAHKCSIFMIVFPIVVILILIAVQLITRFVIAGDDDEEDHDHD
mmetsp:Transcript_34092/g.42136  ORF Transcript_34092/g.42136 Transcript_34092/m.42136 type:complete len:102 (-) Transcript_34092:133-438(-)